MVMLLNRKNKYCQLPIEVIPLLTNRNWLSHQYIDLFKSIPIIAKELDVSPGTVRRYINMYNIETRGQKDDTMISQLGIEKYKMIRNRSWLYDNYITQHKSITTISKEYGISYSTIRRALHREKIDIRYVYTNHPKLDNYDWLYLQYITNKRDCRDIASEFGVSDVTVSSHLKKHKIPVRNASEALTGELSPMWKGGISFEPYCPKFNSDLKRRIRLFFNNTCIMCGKTSDECGRLMDCHHIEYDKLACCDGKPVQFATLCSHCHGRTTNGNRARWESMLHRIIDEVYAGRSYYTKQEFDEIGEITNGTM